MMARGGGTTVVLRTGRLLAVAAVVLLAALAEVGPAGSRSAAASGAPEAAARLGGAWTGRWVAGDSGRNGAAEVIIAPEVGTSTVVAHVTFVDGGVADTVRREGRLTRSGLFFDLVGGGALVLTLESGDQLTGEFAGGPDVPARFGTLTLSRRARG